MDMSKPSLIERALARLDAAVRDLEDVGNDLLGRMHDAGGASDDIERLSAELAAMRSDYESLSLTSRQASGRIDAAIGRLRAVLEH